MLPPVTVAENDSRAKCVRALEVIRERDKFLLLGYVVMPDHVHLLISEPSKATPSVVLKALKQRVSRDLRKKRRNIASGQLRMVFMDGDLGLPHFWQARFYDFNVYSGYKVREKLEHVHANPVKHGLVKNPSAWICGVVFFFMRRERLG